MIDAAANGLPEGATLGTIAEIAPYFSEWIELPEATKRAGRSIQVKVWAIPQSLYLATIPPEYLRLTGESREDCLARIQQAQEALGPDERLQMQLRLDASVYAVIAAGLEIPRITEAEARRYGPDAAAIYTGIMRATGLI